MKSVFTTEDTESTEKKLKQDLCAASDFVVNSSCARPDREALQARTTHRGCTLPEKRFSVLSVSSVVNRVFEPATACFGRQPCF